MDESKADDVLRSMMSVPCCLQTKMMFFVDRKKRIGRNLVAVRKNRMPLDEDTIFNFF